MIEQLQEEIKTKANPEKARNLQRFFKTGEGQYGEGDLFLGIMVPIQRKIVKEFWNKVSLNDLQVLLNSKIHEERLIALLILVQKYKKACKEKAESEKEKIFNFYLKNAKKGNINNWDLVDLSAPNIVGDYLLNKNKTILYTLAKSSNLWEKRISILATATFIRNNEFKDTLEISEILLKDKHDLIHKAVGWMLREVGKKNVSVLRNFLDKHKTVMPRTTLRYAIERLPEKERKNYLA